MAQREQIRPLRGLRIAAAVSLAAAASAFLACSASSSSPEGPPSSGGSGGSTSGSSGGPSSSGPAGSSGGGSGGASSSGDTGAGSSSGGGTGTASSSGASSGSGGSSGGAGDDGGTTNEGGDDAAGGAEDAPSGADAPVTGDGASGDFPIPPGMTKIFDGTTLTGWNGNSSIWSVNAADHAIEGKTMNGGQLIKTTASYDSFRIVLTERMVATNNHLGICFWGTSTAGYGYDGCADVIPPITGIWDYTTNGNVAMGKGDNGIRFMWHQVEILAIAASGRVLAAVNGVQTQDFTYPKGAARVKMSPIGLQAHAGASDEEYKDIWVEANPQNMTLVTVK